MKVSKAENERLCEQLALLRATALRVSAKFGTSDEGEPSDWSEWAGLRRECSKVDTLIGAPKTAYI